MAVILYCADCGQEDDDHALSLDAGGVVRAGVWREPNKFVFCEPKEMAALRAVLGAAQELLQYGSYQRDDGLIDTEGRHFQALRTAVQEAQAQAVGGGEGEGE